ncbi:unnamed protein product [Rotaria sp. Silwood2]|nr:unnamed protein product [Rotaria sp. Silwood2]CAF2978359.1 unnamed protein product [Rotaria sp. Silwood2]CAF3283592.1 unnamed protein product [Rotaria sp. Silwood2]CAF3362324.1 unnamed protein product [Rotaria sp. Silwood2]CAF4060130.1 unnamed protein product [Rotaria sp. Silwood2]
MQFHWIAPLTLVPFVQRRKKIAYILAIMYVFIGMRSTLGLLYYSNYNPNMMRNALEPSANVNGQTYFNVIYVTPWRRISSYAIGLLTGSMVTNQYTSYILCS